MAATKGIVELGKPYSFPKVLDCRITLLCFYTYSRKEHGGLCNSGIFDRYRKWWWRATDMFVMTAETRSSKMCDYFETNEKSTKDKFGE